MAELWGTSANETLNGTPDDDQIQTAGGADVVNAGAGDDWVNSLITPAGAYQYYDFAGSAYIDGGDGNDVLTGTTGNDTMSAPIEY